MIIENEDLASQQQNEETTKKNWITPIIESKWPKDKIIMEYTFTNGRISVDEYNLSHRGKKKKADYLLLHQNNLALAVVEAKGMNHWADEGYGQVKTMLTYLMFHLLMLRMERISSNMITFLVFQEP